MKSKEKILSEFEALKPPMPYPSDVGREEYENNKFLRDWFAQSLIEYGKWLIEKGKPPRYPEVKGAPNENFDAGYNRSTEDYCAYMERINGTV